MTDVHTKRGSFDTNGEEEHYVNMKTEIWVMCLKAYLGLVPDHNKASNTIKRVVIYLLVESLAFNSLKKKKKMQYW